MEKWHHPGGKLRELGAESLTDAELLSILISTGTKGKSAEKIAEDIIRHVVKNPQQKLPSKKGRVIVQNKYYDQTENKEMLIRVVGTETFKKFTVVTVYKTSKINKYWVEGG